MHLGKPGDSIEAFSRYLDMTIPELMARYAVPGVVLVVAIITAALLLIAARQNRWQTGCIVRKLAEAASPVDFRQDDLEQMEGLPDPVLRYFRHVFLAGAEPASMMTIHQRGKLRIDPSARRWSPFSATYYVTENPAGFVWDARIRIAPMMHFQVRDVFVDGVGAGAVHLLSAIPLGHDKDKPELNSGALYRYLAEAVWHPAALLPQSGVIWRAMDEAHAMATLTVAGITVSLEFRFNRLGEIIGVYTEERFGRFDGQYKKYPWEGHFSHYRKIGGVRIPLYGEVGWHLPEGWWLFWKGEIVISR